MQMVATYELQYALMETLYATGPTDGILDGALVALIKGATKTDRTTTLADLTLAEFDDSTPAAVEALGTRYLSSDGRVSLDMDCAHWSSLSALNDENIIGAALVSGVGEGGKVWAVGLFEEAKAINTENDALTVHMSIKFPGDEDWGEVEGND